MKLYILISDIEKEFNERLNSKKINYDIIHKQYLISNLTSNIKEDINNKDLFIFYINTYYLILSEVLEDFYYTNSNQEINLKSFKKHYSIYFTNKLKSILIGSFS